MIDMQIAAFYPSWIVVSAIPVNITNRNEKIGYNSYAAELTALIFFFDNF